LAGCQDKHIKAFYINRHNRAVCIIQKTVSKEANGNNYMIMDAGKQDELPDAVRMQRMPDTLRPPHINKEEWRKLRPDLVMITGMLANETPMHGTKPHIEMVELGYCSDTNHDVKIKETEQQHAQLLDRLPSSQKQAREWQPGLERRPTLTQPNATDGGTPKLRSLSGGLP
jgi:hypothetical protein